ncbi:MAG: PAS domain S-box protein [bacterium]|nr:PAS domain S-box protein [bacterium]
MSVKQFLLTVLFLCLPALPIPGAGGNAAAPVTESTGIGVTVTVKDLLQQARRHKENDPKKFLELSKRALELLANSPDGTKPLKAKVLYAVSEAYAAMKDYEQAYRYYKLFKAQDDRTFNEITGSEMAKMQASYEIQNKETRIEVLEEREKFQKSELLRQQSLVRFYWALGILIVVILVVNFFLFRRKQQTETAYRESEEKYRQLVERANDGIALFRDGLCLYSNPILTELLGYKREEAMGASFEKFVMPEERERIKKFYQMHADGQKGPSHYESRLQHKEGDIIDVEINAGIIRYEKRPAIMLFIRDISERKLLEEERLKREKLESIGILAGGIAHDFNNLLGVILGYLDLLRHSLPLEAKERETFDKIEEATLKAEELARQFITFSKGGVPTKREASVKRLIQQAVERAVASPNLELPVENYQFKTNLPSDPLCCHCDPEQIKQSVSNLLVNSMEAMPSGGDISVDVEYAHITPDDIPELVEGNYIKIEVTDRGEGIQKGNLFKVFDPYFSTKKRVSQRGLGLGLSIVYSIVKRHKGHIQIESEPGAGTTTTVYVPAMEHHPS